MKTRMTNVMPLCRSASLAFSFVSFYILSDVWLQHLFTEARQEEPVSFIYALRRPLHSNSFSNVNSVISGSLIVSKIKKSRCSF